MEKEHGLREAIAKILTDAFVDVAEDRVVHYIIRELHQGRKIKDILDDPYVRNRVNETQLEKVMEDETVLKAVEDEMRKAFAAWDFKFEE